MDPWWSGKHAAHSGNVQVLAAPDGWPIWTSPVRPGREHDTTCLRAHTEVLPVLAEWIDQTHAVLGDLGYEGEQAALTGMGGSGSSAPSPGQARGRPEPPSGPSSSPSQNCVRRIARAADLLTNRLEGADHEHRATTARRRYRADYAGAALRSRRLERSRRVRRPGGGPASPAGPRRRGARRRVLNVDGSPWRSRPPPRRPPTTGTARLAGLGRAAAGHGRGGGAPGGRLALAPDPLRAAGGPTGPTRVRSWAYGGRWDT